MGVVVLAVLAFALTPGDAATPKRDYASAAWSVLPPGENGSLTFNRNTRDQAALYDGLTVLGGNVAPADIGRYFKPAPLGLGKDRARTRDEPRGGVTVVRDSFGVAHVTGKTEADVAFGAGWVTAEDRGTLLQLLRGPARIAALDVPGLDPFEVAFSRAELRPEPGGGGIPLQSGGCAPVARPEGPEHPRDHACVRRGDQRVEPAEQRSRGARSRRTTSSR